MSLTHVAGAVCLFMVTASWVAVRVAQAQTSPPTADLVNQLGDKNEQRMMVAVEALMKQGPQAIPALIEALDKRQECQMQFVASGVLRKIEPGHARIEPTLARLARGECSGGSQQDFVLKQDSAFALSVTPSGIALLVEMVSHKDTLTRRRVAFAFEDLTEKIESTTEGLTLPATLVQPIAQGLPKLATFLDERDEVLRCVTFEAMQQASASRHPQIASAGKSVLAGKTINCGR